MIYIVRRCFAYDSQNFKCATNNLSFAKDVYDIELKSIEFNSRYEWVELLCLDGQKHYSYPQYKTMQTSYND